MRRVTTGPAADRWPTWSPDGTQIAFYSNRGENGYQIHIIDADGTGARQITHHSGIAFFPRWTRDGRGVLFADIMSAQRGTYLVDPNEPWSEQTPTALPPPGEGLYFWGESFSPDGTQVIGMVMNPAQMTEVGGRGATAVYSFETGTYRFADKAFIGTNTDKWLDERRVLVRDGSDTWVLDVETMEARLVLKGIIVQAVAPDGRTIYFARANEQADIWMATLR